MEIHKKNQLVIYNMEIHKENELVIYNMEIDLRNQACNIQYRNLFKKSGL
jgi:hypothetical protein